MLSDSSLPTFNLPNSLAILSSSLIIYYLSWIVYARFFHPYHDIPGPFFASFSGWWYFRTIRYGIRDNSQLPLHKKYGKFVRIAPNEVQISDPKALEVIYGNKPIFPKTEFYDSFSPRISDRTDTFTERNEAIHTAARKIVAPLYTQGSILAYEPMIDNTVGIFGQCMDSFAASGEVFDISTYLRKYSFDAVGEMFYGREGGFGFLRDNIDYNGWMGMLDVMVPPVSSLGYVPYGLQTLYLISQLIFNPQTRKGLKAADTVVAQSKSVVKERKIEMAAGKEFKRNDFLSKLMDMTITKAKNADFNDDDVAVNVWTIIWAGSDTTGYVLTSILYHALKHPDVYKKLVAEIDDAFEDGKISFPVRYNDAIKLPYLNACVREGMRVLPAVGTGFPRYVPKGGAVIAGRYFPEGYKVIMNANAVHFDASVFGADAEEYNPERWSQNDEKTIANMGRHEMGFGLGPRVCLGKQVTMTEMYKLLPAILKRYHFELMSPEIKVTHCWFQTPRNVMVRVSKR